MVECGARKNASQVAAKKRDAAAERYEQLEAAAACLPFSFVFWGHVREWCAEAVREWFVGPVRGWCAGAVGGWCVGRRLYTFLDLALWMWDTDAATVQGHTHLGVTVGALTILHRL